MKQLGMAGATGVIGFVPAGVIFDVDDTLLDNHPPTSGLGLHEQARLRALHEVGEERGITELATVSQELNFEVIKRSKEHTVEGTFWQLFYELGLVGSDTIDHTNPLLQEVVARKNALYDPILREFGVPLPEAIEFVKAVYVLTDGKIAIASGGRQHNIETFLEMTGLDDYFLPERIISHQHVSRAKPDPEAFDLAFKTLGLPESERAHVVAFEDDPKGITSAKQAGLFVAAITTRFDQKTLEANNPTADLIHPTYIDFAEAFGITL